jgi:HK97 family phage portal protein
MGLLERIEQARQPQNAWPVGPAEGYRMSPELRRGESEFNPESYGNYIATSNEIYSVVSQRARLMSGLKLDLFKGREHDKKSVTAGPAYDLLRHVNPFWTWKRLVRMDELSMGVWGESFWAIEKDRAGTPKNIWWMKSPRVTPVPDASGYLRGFVYESVAGEPIPFGADEVVWFRYPNPIDEFSPLSPLAAARLAADTAKAMQVANGKLFDNGLTAAGLVVPAGDKVTFSEEQGNELEDFLDKRLRGADKAHRWAVLRFDAEFKGLNVTPKDAEYVAGMNMTLRQVCNAYGWPSPLLNDPTGATLTNLREYQKQAWEHALVPDADFKAEEIEEQLLPMFNGVGRGQVDHVAWDYSKVAALQESASEAWTREYQAIDRGALTINEWRRSHGKPDVPWGDVYWAPVNKEPVEDGEPARTEPLDQGETQMRAVIQQMRDLSGQFAAFNREGAG